RARKRRGWEHERADVAGAVAGDRRYAAVELVAAAERRGARGGVVDGADAQPPGAAVVSGQGAVRGQELEHPEDGAGARGDHPRADGAGGGGADSGRGTVAADRGADRQPAGGGGGDGAGSPRRSREGTS